MNTGIKILIIRRSALGDTIHTLPLLSALKKKNPDSVIDWVVDEKASYFLINHPLINNLYILRKSGKNRIEGFKDFLSVIKEIRAQKYDIAIDTQQLLKSSVIMGLSGAKRKIALSDGREFSGIFANEIIKSSRRQFDIHYHVVKRNLEIAAYLEADTEKTEFVLPEISQTAKEKVKNLLSVLDKTKKTLVISPETTWVNKHWDENCWREVIGEFIGKVNIIYTGTKNDKGLSERILKGFDENSFINLKGRTTLEDMREVFHYADLLVSPDSGTAHIAWAEGKCAVLTLFFATSGERTAPFGDRYRFVQANCKCSPCMKKSCSEKDKNLCTKSVNSKEILKIMNNLLQFG